jgi:hypothetical protein
MNQPLAPTTNTEHSTTTLDGTTDGQTDQRRQFRIRANFYQAGTMARPMVVKPVDNQNSVESEANLELQSPVQTFDVAG